MEVGAPMKRLPLLIVLLTLLVVFYRLLLGEVFFWGLPALQFYPWREFAFDTLRAGQLPLWNPYNGAGAPLIANYQSMLFYPFTWIGLVLPLAWAMSVTAVLHLFIAAWGMWLFTGRLGLPALGRGVSALAFGLTSYLVARLGTYPMIAASAWLPFMMWASLGVIQHKRLRDVGWLALFTGLQLLAGHAQTAWYSLMLVGLFVLFTALRHREKDWWQRLGRAAAGVILGAAIATVQLWPTAELLRTSQRSEGVDFDFAMNFSYGPARALNLISPNVFGNPGEGTYLTEGAFFEDAVYIGLLPFVSALAAIIGWIVRRFRKGLDELPAASSMPFWLVITLVAFVFALGKYTPIFPFLFNNVPTFDLFQAPVRWHLWTVLALSVLAGIGTRSWGRGHWLFFGTRLAIAGCIAAALLALFVAPALIPTDGDPELAQAIGVLRLAVAATGILGALAGALTLLQPERGSSRYSWWSLVVLVVVAIDLGWAAWGLNPTVPAAFYEKGPNDEQARAYWPEEAERAVEFDTHLLFKDYRVATENWEAFRASELPNLNLLDRWHLLNNFDPLRVGPFVQYLDLIEANLPDADNLLQAAQVNALYEETGERSALVSPVERAWFVESVCWHTDEASLVEALSNPDWLPLRQAHFIGEGDCPALAEDAASIGTVISLEDRANSLGVNVETEAGGWLVLADTNYPGWTASVDGVPVQIAQANLAFRVVEVPAGGRVIHFEYRPAWLLPGMLISLAALVITLALFRLRNPQVLNR
jgi:hypothetical protein